MQRIQVFSQVTNGPIFIGAGKHSMIETSCDSRNILCWSDSGWNNTDGWLDHGWNNTDGWSDGGWNNTDGWLDHGWNNTDTWSDGGWNNW